MQGFILPAITAAEKYTLFLDSRLDVNFLDLTQKFEKVSGA